MTATDQSPARKRSENALIIGLSISNVISIGCLFHSFTLFLRPMNEAFDWSATQMTGAFTLGLFTADLVAIPVGQWVDRRGGHLVMAFGATIASVLLIAWSYVDSLAGFYALWLALGIAIGCTLGNTSASIITANTTDYKRGLTLLSIVSGLSSTAVVPVVSVLMAYFGWRAALIGLAVMQFAGPALINAFLLRGTVGSRTEEFARRKSLRAAGEPTNVGSMATSPLRTAMRRPAFWLLTVAASIHWFTIFGLNVHFMPLLQQRGVGVQMAVLVFSLTGPAAVAARILLHVVDPKGSAKRQGRIFFPMFASSILLLILVAPLGTPYLILYAIFFGMSGGVLMIVRQTAVAEFFGLRGYGAISGAMTTVSSVPRTCAPLVVALMADSFGSYEPVLWVIFGLVLLATVAFYAASVGVDQSD